MLSNRISFLCKTDLKKGFYSDYFSFQGLPQSSKTSSGDQS